MKIAFLGPEGTFSEEALFAAIDPVEVEAVPLPTIYDCVMAVQDRQVERAFVPIENSLEGSVSATLDTLVFETEQVEIVGEVIHPVRHSLIARVELGLGQIERVVSHPQANAQCARFLRERLGQAEVVAAPSTADAVRIVAESDRPWAALGTRLSAELNDCRVLLEGVEDHPENETRFVLLGQKMPAVAKNWAGPAKTSVVFWGMPDAPGSLMEVLRAFADRNVNLSKIESRPLKQGLGRYIFFIDIEGSGEDPDVAGALEAIGGQVDTVRVLGSYPAARST